MPVSTRGMAVVIFHLLCLLTSTESKEWKIDGLPLGRALNLAHRGSSGMLPEHTVAAYQLAVEQGADVIECDVQITKDLLLVCAHDIWLNKTTDVHSKPEFHGRLRTYTFNGVNYTDYFTIDFTLAELKTLRKVSTDIKIKAGKFAMQSKGKHI